MTQPDADEVTEPSREIDLRKPKYSPDVNPFAEQVVAAVSSSTKNKKIRTSTADHFVNPDTGEVMATSTIYVIEKREEEQFVKVFVDGVRRTFDLSKSANQVFCRILEEYQKVKMTGGYADQIRLAWFDGGLNGSSVDLSEYVFRKGLKELITKSFLYPCAPGVYWINPSLFFKGDRVRFVQEYQKINANNKFEKTVDQVEKKREELKVEQQLDLEDITGPTNQPEPARGRGGFPSRSK